MTRLLFQTSLICYENVEKAWTSPACPADPPGRAVGAPPGPTW
jgi:hypothetical protein